MLLPVSATTSVAATASTMEAAATTTAESAAGSTAACISTVSRWGSTSNSATRYARPCSATVAWASSTETAFSAGITAASAVSDSATTISVSAATISVSAAIAAPSVAITPTAPWAYAKKHAAVEPIGSVEAVRSAGIRVVGVIAPLTCRGTIGYWGDSNFGADTNPDSHLGVCCRSRERQSQKQCKQNQA